MSSQDLFSFILVIFQAALPPIDSLLSADQPVNVVVLDQVDRNGKTGKGSKKSLALSMRASLLHRGLTIHHLVDGFPLTGSVSSREDHGYIISAGISGLNCFLPFKAVPESVGVDLPIGETHLILLSNDGAHDCYYAVT